MSPIFDEEPDVGTLMSERTGLNSMRHIPAGPNEAGAGGAALIGFAFVFPKRGVRDVGPAASE